MKKEKPKEVVDVNVEIQKKEAKELIGKMANPKCSKCGGTGTKGWNRTYNHWVMCKCATRKIINEELKNEGEQSDVRN